MKVEIIDITDRSGSMSTLAPDVIGGFNVLVNEQKKVDGEARLTQVLFDHEYDVLYTAKDINDIPPLTTEIYVPRGSTALLDAIGRTLNEQGERIHKENWADKVIVCIRTDGQENASRHFTLPRIKEMIEHAQKCGWVFIFAAANQDAFQAASSYGIHAQYTSNFVASAAGMGQSYAATSQVLRNLRADINDAYEQTKVEKTPQV